MYHFLEIRLEAGESASRLDATFIKFHRFDDFSVYRAVLILIRIPKIVSIRNRRNFNFRGERSPVINWSSPRLRILSVCFSDLHLLINYSETLDALSWYSKLLSICAMCCLKFLDRFCPFSLYRVTSQRPSLISFDINC